MKESLEYLDLIKKNIALEDMKKDYLKIESILEEEIQIVKKEICKNIRDIEEEIHENNIKMEIIRLESEYNNKNS